MAKKRKANSVLKGKEGERAAAKYLGSLGFDGARRTQQRTGDSGDSDLVCDSLPSVFIEVKYGYPLNDFDISHEEFEKVCEKASRQAIAGKFFEWVILWKPKQHRKWRLTFTIGFGHVATVCGDERIGCILASFQGLKPLIGKD